MIMESVIYVSFALAYAKIAANVEFHIQENPRMRPALKDNWTNVMLQQPQSTK
ncbi:hypothetical protein SOVF_051960 [Spinacia oleracea]|nr:hypothetical protein SOVF_051960 [Spinacia oleracea]